MTPEEIAQKVNDGEKLSRADVEAILAYYNDPDNAYVNMQTFLELTNMTNEQKLTILQDLESYE